MKPKFDPGRVVMTIGIDCACKDNPEFEKKMYYSLIRHLCGDWGDVYPEEKEQNDSALLNGNDRIFSVYKFSEYEGDTIWIITEWDRSYTTILFPDEY